MKFSDDKFEQAAEEYVTEKAPSNTWNMYSISRYENDIERAKAFKAGAEWALKERMTNCSVQLCEGGIWDCMKPDFEKRIAELEEERDSLKDQLAWSHRNEEQYKKALKEKHDDWVIARDKNLIRASIKTQDASEPCEWEDEG